MVRRLRYTNHALALFLYNILLILLAPVIAAVLAYRAARGKESRPHLRERFGFLPDAINTDTRTERFWVHAVSVGEVMAAIPVLRELRARHPDALIVLSTTTASGREVAAKQVPPADFVIQFPLDFPLVVANALRTIRPRALLLMEWEIWPNLLSVAKKRGVTVAVINGRVSETGLRRGVRARYFLAPALQNVAVFAMQSAEDAHRAAQVGAPATHIFNVGNTKFDESTAMLTDAERDALRVSLGIPPSVPVFIGGSTRDAPTAETPDEETQLCETITRISSTIPGTFFIVAPRHLERADAVAVVLSTVGNVHRRSKNVHGASIPDMERPQILLLDTFGELARAYGVADAAFVGGSLVRRGGQSVFQPLAQGVPAVFGTHMNNQRDIAALAVAENVGFTVQNADELADVVIRLLTLPPDEKAALSHRCRALIEHNQGVTGRALDLVEAAMRGRNR